MDHETAIRIQAAERYVLEEFPAEERGAFEEHFFECPECAEEVRSATIFAANAAQALREERAKDTAKLKSPDGGFRRWFWFPLAASAALNVALLTGVGIERLKPANASVAIEPQFYQTIAVTGASRGTQSAIPVVKGAQFLGVRFDLMAGQHFDSFEYQILDTNGGSRTEKSLPAPSGEYSELELAVPVKGLAPGDDVVVLRGKQSGNWTEIGRRTIEIPR